jgi:hypothetical protein
VQPWLFGWSREYTKSGQKETVMMPFKRACLAASAVLCFAIDPAAAQYNIFDSQSGPYTDVIVNGQPESLDSVRQFEQRCQIRAAAGQWWLDLNNGNFGQVGGPAIYNINTCQPLTGRDGSEDNLARRRKSATEGSCTFFSGGSICSGPGWRTVN